MPVGRTMLQARRARTWGWSSKFNCPAGDRRKRNILYDRTSCMIMDGYSRFFVSVGVVDHLRVRCSSTKTVHAPTRIQHALDMTTIYSVTYTCHRSRTQMFVLVNSKVFFKGDPCAPHGEEHQRTQHSENQIVVWTDLMKRFSLEGSDKPCWFCRSYWDSNEWVRWVNYLHNLIFDSQLVEYL